MSNKVDEAIKTVEIIGDVIKDITGDNKTIGNISKGISIAKKISFIFRVLMAKRTDFGSNVQQAYKETTKSIIPLDKNTFSDLSLRVDIAKEHLKNIKDDS